MYNIYVHIYIYASNNGNHMGKTMDNEMKPSNIRPKMPVTRACKTMLHGQPTHATLQILHATRGVHLVGNSSP